MNELKATIEGLRLQSRSHTLASGLGGGGGGSGGGGGGAGGSLPRQTTDQVGASTKDSTCSGKENGLNTDAGRLLSITTTACKTSITTLSPPPSSSPTPLSPPLSPPPLSQRPLSPRPLSPPWQYLPQNNAIKYNLRSRPHNVLLPPKDDSLSHVCSLGSLSERSKHYT